MATTLARGSLEKATLVTPAAASTAPAASPRSSRRSILSDESDSNDSWDVYEMMVYNPKIATMMWDHKKSKGKNVYSYHGSLSLFNT